MYDCDAYDEPADWDSSYEITSRYCWKKEQFGTAVVWNDEEAEMAEVEAWADLATTACSFKWKAKSAFEQGFYKGLNIMPSIIARPGAGHFQFLVEYIYSKNKGKAFYKCTATLFNVDSDTEEIEICEKWGSSAAQAFVRASQKAKEWASSRKEQVQKARIACEKIEWGIA